MKYHSGRLFIVSCVLACGCGGSDSTTNPSTEGGLDATGSGESGAMDANAPHDSGHDATADSSVSEGGTADGSTSDGATSDGQSSDGSSSDGASTEAGGPDGGGGDAFKMKHPVASFEVKMPTLVIWGEKDPYILTGNLDGLEQYVAKLTVKRIPDATHWVVHEKSARVNELIRDFLETDPE